MPGLESGSSHMFGKLPPHLLFWGFVKGILLDMKVMFFIVILISISLMASSVFSFMTVLPRAYWAAWEGNVFAIVYAMRQMNSNAAFAGSERLAGERHRVIIRYRSGTSVNRFAEFRSWNKWYSFKIEALDLISGCLEVSLNAGLRYSEPALDRGLA